MGIDGFHEGCFCSFLKIVSVAAVGMQFYGTGNYFSAVGVDDGCAVVWCLFNFGDFQDLASSDQKTAVSNPTLRGKNTSVPEK